MKEENIHIRSEEVQEILGTPPRWIIRWGISVIFLVFLILLSGSYFFKYPDFISSRVTILSQNPPVHIVARSNGKIDQLFVENNQQVTEGDLLAVIENTADYSDAYNLISKLDSIAGYFDTPSNFIDIAFNEDYSLGQYQTYFSSFISQMKKYQTFLIYNPNDQRIESLKKQVEDYQYFLKQTREQISILRQDYELAISRYSRDSLLYARQIMSKAEFEESKASMLKRKVSYQNAMTDLANTQIIMNNLKHQIQEQEVLKAETENQLLAGLKEKYDNLINQLIEWEQNYILKTPISGQITFTNIWSANQFVTSGKPVFTVVPVNKQSIIGRATVTIMGAGKIEAGQRVNIKLDNYPHMEYGILEGKVHNISKVPVNTDEGAFYTVEITLVNDMITNYNRELPFNQEMQGVAEIITRERRMIERLIEPLVSTVKERL